MVLFLKDPERNLHSLTSAPGKPVESIKHNVGSQECCMAFVESIPFWQTAVQVLYCLVRTEYGCDV